MSKALIAIGVLVVILLCVAGWLIVNYNGLITLDENVQTAWSNVQTNYQRRADLYATQLPVVVAAAAQELAVFRELRRQAEALRATLPNYESAPTGADAEQLADQLAAFDAAVNNFTVYVADNPEIVSAQLYSDFTVTIEGTENRINVARRDYNETVRTFRTRVRSFPNILIASLLGFSPDKYAYFEAQPGTDVAPTLVFPTPMP